MLPTSGYFPCTCNQFLDIGDTKFTQEHLKSCPLFQKKYEKAIKTINNLALQFSSEDDKKALSCIFGLTVFHGADISMSNKISKSRQLINEEKEDDLYDFSEEENVQITPQDPPKKKATFTLSKKKNSTGFPCESCYKTISSDQIV